MVFAIKLPVEQLDLSTVTPPRSGSKVDRLRSSCWCFQFEVSSELGPRTLAFYRPKPCRRTALQIFAKDMMLVVIEDFSFFVVYTPEPLLATVSL